MPRERIPQHKFLRLQVKPEQRAPNDRCCWLGKTIRALFTLACSPWLAAEKNMFRFYSGIFLFSQQDSLGGHGDPAEMPAAITERFTNHNKLYLAEPFAKIGTQMLSSDRGRVAVNVVLLIDLPP